MFVGAFYQELSAIVSSYLAILIVLGAPWSIINLIGYFNNRGYYDSDSLQVYNRGQMGGRYWSSVGLNHRAVIAWLAAVVIGMFFVNTGWYVGPGAELFNGADMGFIVSTLVGAVVYLAFLKLESGTRIYLRPRGCAHRQCSAVTLWRFHAYSADGPVQSPVAIWLIPAAPCS